MAMDTPGGAWLESVWGASEDAVFAVGEGETILRFDGGGWASMESGTSETLVGVWGSSDQNV